MDTCCHILSCEHPNAHVNDPDDGYRIETVVNVGSGNSSPVSSLPAIVRCPIDGTCSITIPASDNEGDPVGMRLSTPAESLIANQPGPPHCPLSASVVDDHYVWDTTGASSATINAVSPTSTPCTRPR